MNAISRDLVDAAAAAGDLPVEITLFQFNFFNENENETDLEALSRWINAVVTCNLQLCKLALKMYQDVPTVWLAQEMMHVQ